MPSHCLTRPQSLDRQICQNARHMYLPSTLNCIVLLCYHLKSCCIPSGCHYKQTFMCYGTSAIITPSITQLVIARVDLPYIYYELLVIVTQFNRQCMHVIDCTLYACVPPSCLSVCGMPFVLLAHDTLVIRTLVHGSLS